MSPFRDDFKFDVVNQTSVKIPEAMPKYFLADTLVEAEEVYAQFSSLLNALAFNYAMSTGLAKADLFGEGLIGLGRAYRDWDADRGGEFRPYATFRIKDSIIEYIRDRSATVRVPTYIKKAAYLLEKLKWWCEILDVEYHMMLKPSRWEGSGIAKDVDDEAPFLRAVGIARTLKEYSNRAKVKDIDKFVERIENIPEEVDFAEPVNDDAHDRSQELMEAALIVDKLKEYMDETELAICEGIMQDKSFEEIGKGFGHSKSWVSDRMAKLRKKIAAKLKEGTL